MIDPVITTRRLILRGARAGDADDIYRNINDRDVICMIARPPWPYPRALADEFVATSDASMIEYDGEVIGAIGIAKRAHGFNLGFWIGKPHWGKGFMTEAAAGLIAAFFTDVPDEDLHYEDLHSAYLVDNPASWRVQQKLGFKTVGPCMLQINSRGGAQPGFKTLLKREAFRTLVP